MDYRMLEAVKSLFILPSAAHLQTVRSLLACDARYNPYSDDLDRLDDLVQAGRYGEALKVYAQSLPNLVLSVRAHHLASEAGMQLGNKEFAEQENALRHKLPGGRVGSGRRQLVEAFPGRPLDG